MNTMSKPRPAIVPLSASAFLWALIARSFAGRQRPVYRKQSAKGAPRRFIGHSMLVALFLGASLVQPSNLLAQNPSCPVPIVSCSGNGQSSTIKFLVGGVPQNDVTLHVGDTLSYQLTVSVPPDQSCAATNVDAFLKTADGTVVQFLSHACIAGNGGSIICPGDPACINTSQLKYTVMATDVGKSFSLAEPNGLPNSGSNICFVSPSSRRVGAVLNAVGISVGPTAVNTYSSCNNITASVITPGIACTKFCTNNAGGDGTIFFSGTVSNTGTNTGSEQLRNITVSNLVNGVLTLVTNIPTLDAGQSASFGGSYSNPNFCAPISDTIFVSGIDLATVSYTRTNSSSCSATCSNLLSPSFRLSKACVTNPVPFGADVFTSGTFTNTGNVTLTNITIDDNQPSNPTRLVGPITLAPGGFTNFIRSYTPANPCAPFPDTLTANASTICGVALTSQTAAITCNNTPPVPQLLLTKSCPGTNGLPGGVIGFSGTVTNAGNVTLTNIVIVNNQPTNNTPVTMIGRLDPGQGATFSGTEPVPFDVCSLTDTLTATA